MKDRTKPGRGRWRRRALIVLGALAALLVGLILIADTAWVKGRLLAAVNRRLKDGFGLTLRVGEFHLRLPSLSAKMRDVRVEPLESGAPEPGRAVFWADEVFVNLAWSTLFSSTITAEEIRIVKPRLEAAVPAGLPRGAPAEPSRPARPSARPVSFRVGRFTLVGGEALLGGRQTAFNAALTGIGLNIHDLPARDDHQGTLECAGVRIHALGRDIDIKDLSADFLLNEERLRLNRLIARTSASAVEVKGEIKGYQTKAEMKAEVAVSLDAEEAAGFLPSLGPMRGRVLLSGEVLNGGGTVSFSGRLESDGFKLKNLPEVSLTAEFLGDRTAFKVRELKLKAASGRLNGSAEVQISGDGESSAVLEWEGFDLADFPAAFASLPFAPAATLAGRLEARWREMRPSAIRAGGTAFLRLLQNVPAIKDKPIVPLAGEIDFQTTENGIDFSRGSFESGNTRLSLSGHLGWNLAYRARVKAVFSDIGEVARFVPARLIPGTIGGRATFEGLLEGTPDAPAGRGEITAQGLAFDEITISTLKAALGFNRDSLDLASLEADLAGGSVIMQGRVKWRSDGRPLGPQDMLTLSVSGISLEPFARFLPAKFRSGWGGRLAAAKVELRGLPSRPEADVKATLSPLRVKGLELGLLEVSGRREGDGRISVEEFRLDAGEGSIQGHGGLDPGRRTFEAVAATSRFDLAVLAPLLPEAGGISGEVAFDLRGEGSFASPLLTVKLEGKNIASRGFSIPAVALDVVSDGKSARGTLTAEDPGVRLDVELLFERPYVLTGTIRAEQFPLHLFVPRVKPGLALPPAPVRVSGEFRAALQKPEDFSARFTLSGLDLGKLATLGGGMAAGLGGEADAQVSLSGNPARPAGMRAEAEISRLRLTSEGLTLENRAPLHFEFRDQTITIRDFRLYAENSELTVSGSVRSVLHAPEFDVRLSMDLDAALLPRELLRAAAGGRLKMNLAAQGPLSRPRVEGQADFTAGYVQLLDFPLRMTDVVLRLAFQDGSVVLTEGKGLANDGPFSLSGRMDHSGLRIVRVLLDGTVAGFRLDYPEGLLTVSEGRARLEGDGQSWLLSGEVKVLGGSFREDVYPGAEMLGISSLPLLEPGQVVPASYHRFKLDLGVATAEPLVVSNNIADLAVEADIRIAGTLAVPLLTGRVQAEALGEIVFGERRYTVETARVEFLGKEASDPAIDIVAHTRMTHRGEELEIRLHLFGSARRLTYELTSFPPRSREELSLLVLTGKGFEEIRGNALNTLGSQMIVYFASPLASPVTQSLKKLLKAEDVRIEPLNIASEEDPGARLTLVKRVSERASLIYSLDISRSQRQTWIVDYALVRGFSLRAFRKDEGSYGASFKHSFSLGGAPAFEARSGAGDSQPAGIISGVDIDGDPRLPLLRLEKELRRLKPGEPLKVTELSRTADRLTSLYKKEGYANASITPRLEKDADRGVRVVFHIMAGPPVRFVFRGDRLPGQLVQKVRDVWTGRIPEDANLRAAVDLVRDDLRRRRFFSAAVKAEKAEGGEVAAPGRTAYVFDVRRGPRYRIRGFTVEGNASVPAAAIKKAASDYPFARSRGLWNLVNEPRFALRSISKVYEDLGYRKALVRPPRIDEDHGDRALDITLTVEEGPRSLVRDVVIEGTSVFPASQITAVQALAKGGPFVLSRLNEDRTAVLNLYREKGYRGAEVEVEVLVEPETDDVVLRYKIKEGNLHTIAGVEVGRRGRTKEKFILRTAGLREGQPVTVEGLARAQKNLFDAGLFARVNVTSSPGPAADNREKVVVEVSEAPWLAATYGLRYDSEQKFEGFGEVSLRNLLGGGRSGLLSYRQNARQRDMRFTLKSPYLFGARLDVLAALASTREVREGFTTDETGFTLEQRLSLPLKFTLSFLYRLNRVHTYEDVPSGPFPFDISLLLSEVSTVVMRDGRDDRLDPRHGSFFSLALTYSPEFLGTELPYVSAFGQFSFYRRFGPGLTWAAGVRIGVADAYDQVLIPSRRFFAGGGNSLRGFRQDRVGPIDPYLDRAEGGEAVFIFNQEFRFPLYRAFRGAVFYDAGNVYSTVREMRLSDLRHSLGLGIRYASPLGLIRLDYGVNLSRRPGEPRGVLHVSVGQAF